MGPNAAGHWKRALRERSPGEAIALRAELEELQTRPAFQLIRKLLIEAGDELTSHMVGGPVREQAEYAKLAGEVSGLAELELLQTAIRESAEHAEDQLRGQDESLRPRLEAVG